MARASKVCFSRAALRLMALPVAIVPLSAAVADDSAKRANSGMAADSIEILKSSLRGESGFEVDNVVTTDDGVACIVYRVDNKTGGESRARAVVDGDQVLRSTTGNRRFQEAWNRECAGSKSG